MQREFKKYLVVKNPNDDFEIWTKEMYDEYISGCVAFGSGSAFRVILHFNGDEDLIGDWIKEDKK